MATLAREPVRTDLYCYIYLDGYPAKNENILLSLSAALYGQWDCSAGVLQLLLCDLVGVVYCHTSDHVNQLT